MRKLTIVLVVIFNLFSALAVQGVELMIKPGNVVYITVLGYPELSKKVVVRQDGSTNYPLFANVPIDGMTLQELKELLQPILSRFVERPKLFINMDEFILLDVVVKGKVYNPGTYTTQSPISVQGILTLAGGTRDDADLSHITIIRRESDVEKEIVVDLNKYFLDRDSTVLPELQNQDIVFVPIVSQKSAIRIMGSVLKPGLYTLGKNEDIVDLIYLAGGPLKNANMNRIIHISLQDGKYVNNVFKIRTLQSKGLVDQIPKASPGDIVIVTEYENWESLTWWANTVRDLAYLLSAYIVFSNL